MSSVADWGHPSVAMQASRHVVVVVVVAESVDVAVVGPGKTCFRRRAAVHMTSVPTSVSRPPKLGVGARVPPCAVGLRVGAFVGPAVGACVGLVVGALVGAFVSPMLGQTGFMSLRMGLRVCCGGDVCLVSRPSASG